MTGCPRYALKRVLKKVQICGYTAYLGPELEYFYFKDETSPAIIDRGGYFDGLPIDRGINIRRDKYFHFKRWGYRLNTATMRLHRRSMR